MKQCLQCGSKVEDTVSYCPRCGACNFQAVEEPKKKKKKWIAIPSGMMATILPVGIPMGIRQGLREHRNSQLKQQQTIPVFSSDTMEEIDRILNKQSFTSGEIQNGIYRNEWCQLQFDTTLIPQVEKDIEKSFEDERTDVGFAASDKANHSLFVLCFERLASAKITESEYLDSIVRQLKKQLESEKIEFEFSEKTEAVIAEETYPGVDLSYIGSDYFQSFFVRAYDKRMIVFIVSGSNKREIMDKLSLVTAYHPNNE